MLQFPYLKSTCFLKKSREFFIVFPKPSLICKIPLKPKHDKNSPSSDSCFSSVQLSRSVVSDTLRPHELQHASPPCPSPIPGVYSNSCPSSRLHHPAISSSVFPSSCPQSFPASVFSNESTLHMRSPKYWNFSFNHQSFQ